MAFPTRHWRILSGSLTAGQASAVAHGVTVRGVSVAPDAMLKAFKDNAAGTNSALNNSIGTSAAMDSTNVYLSNYDPSNTQGYNVLVRKYNSVDGTNL